jgi:alpha-glucoside transport system substrate-binding protein
MTLTTRPSARASGLLAAVALLVTACGGGAQSSTAPSPATSSAPTDEAPSAPAGEQIGGEVSILGPWGGDQTAAFEAVLAPFEEHTGITVNYTGSTDLVNILRTGVESGTPPDIADLPSPGILRQYAEEGALVPLDDVFDRENYLDETSTGVAEIGIVDDQIFGIFFLGSIKGLIWYNPNVFGGEAPATWDELAEVAQAAASEAGPGTRPWCVAVGADAATGWPATDWIEDFLLRQSGPEAYDAWVAGELRWTSPEVRAAFEAYGSIVSAEAVYGGPETVLTTPYQDGGNPLFTDPPGCVFHHQASWMSDLFMAQAGAEEGQFDYFAFPEIDPEHAGSVIGAGDYMAMFNDTEQARALISYLATAEAQSIWTEMGGQLSGNRTVTNYPNDLQQRAGEVLANAEIFRFDGSDLMPQEMLQAFWTGILEYTQDPSTLDSVLESLDEAQASAYGG